MIKAQDHNIVRRARLYKAAIGLAMALTLAALVAVLAGGGAHDEQAFKLDGPISKAAADQHK